MWMRHITSLVEVSIGCSIAVLSLLILSPMLRKWFTHRWKYWIWFILAIRLIIPIQVHMFKDVVISLPSVLPDRGVTIQEKVSDLAQSGKIDFTIDKATVDTAVTINDIESKVPWSRIEIGNFVMFVWLVGMILFMAYHLCAYHYIRHQVMRWTRPIRSPMIHEMYGRMLASMGIKREIRLCISEKVSSPMMIGFVEPVLLLPREDYDTLELQYILKHELIHYKRGDMWYKLMMLTANAIHWFNPIIYMMRSRASENIELFCDEEVVKGCSLPERKAYGETILTAIGRGQRCYTALSTYLNQDKKTIKNRLRGIIDMKKKRKGILAFAISVTCILMMSGLMVIGQGATMDGPDSLSDLTIEKGYVEPSDGRNASVTTSEGSTVAKKVDPEAIDGLNNAVLSNDLEYVRGVIKDGSLDINAPNSEGIYPLEMTLIMTNCDMAKLLIEAGADVDMVTSDGETIYDKAMASDSKYYKEIFSQGK